MDTLTISEHQPPHTVFDKGTISVYGTNRKTCTQFSPSGQPKIYKNILGSFLLTMTAQATLTIKERRIYFILKVIVIWLYPVTE
jgi:hypothetical protein